MCKNASELRNELFEKYFEVKDGINLSDLLRVINFITSVWKKISELLNKNIEDYDTYNRLETIKQINHKGKNYLIIKFLFWEYLIIDIDHNKVLDRDDVKKIFEEDFFINHFFEKPLNFSEHFSNVYSFLNYEGDIHELITLYIKLCDYLSLPTYIYYPLNIGDAWTYIGISTINGNIQLGFQTIDQFLYEQVFFNNDLTPYSMQDAHNKIGKEKMNEIFFRIKDIIIPLSVIPEEILLNPNMKKLFDISSKKNDLKELKRKLTTELESNCQR